MSCQRTVKTFETVEVKIDTCNKKELEELEKSIVSSINQKLEKLNILIKNCDIYCNGNCILVHDRFNICSSLIEVANAFGLVGVEINCNLKGKTYLVSDRLTDVLKQLDRKFEFGESVANKELTPEIADILNKYSSGKIDTEILEMIKNIKTNGSYKTTQSREVQETYEDYYLTDRTEGKWISNKEEIRNRFLNLTKMVQQSIRGANENLRDGTVQLLRVRAKQMGYAVKEVKQGKQTQLVLVRYE